MKKNKNKKSKVLKKIIIGALAVLIVGTAPIALTSCGQKEETSSYSDYDKDDYNDSNSDYDDYNTDYDSEDSDYENDDTDNEDSVSSKPKKSKIKKSKVKKVVGVSAKFKKLMDGYEKFMDDYIDFMKKYNDNPTDAELLSAYSDWMKDYADWVEKIDDVDEDELSAADAAYYLKVTARVTKKLAKVQ